MRLSDHFVLAELTVSQNAARLRLDNTPSPAIIDALRETAAMLEQVRRVLGNKPIIVTSGYRSPEVNAVAGGVATSAHCFGRAADFICPGFGPPLDVCHAIAASDIRFDQLIHEFGAWVHLAWSPGLQRRQILTINGAGTRAGL